MSLLYRARKFLGRQSLQCDVVEMLKLWQRQGLIEAYGDYLEFGVFEGNSASLFYRALGDVFGRPPAEALHMFLFDSYEGLPAPQGEADAHASWPENAFAASEEQVRTRLLADGVPTDRFTQVKGYFNTLNAADYSGRIGRAGFVWMDCDFYSSTLDALEFVKPFITPFTVFFFDDLLAFSGHPDKGQAKAIAEFNRRHPELGLVPCPWHSEKSIGRLYWSWKN